MQCIYKILRWHAVGIACLMMQSFCNGSEIRLESTYQKPSLVAVEGGFLEVRVEGQDRSDVAVKAIVDEEDGSNYEWVVESSSHELKLRLHVKSPPQSYANGIITLQIPQNVELCVINSSGDISISHVCSPSLMLRSASGSMALIGCRGKIKASAASGDIDASNLDGHIHLRTISGDQRIENVKGLLDGRTNSGQIEAVDVCGTMDFESSHGSIILDRVDGNLEIETKAGSVKIQKFSIKKEAHIRSITGSIALQMSELNGCNIYAQSDSGSIKYDGKFQPHKWIRELPQAKKSVYIRSVSGNLRLES